MIYLYHKKEPHPERHIKKMYIFATRNRCHEHCSAHIDAFYFISETKSGKFLTARKIKEYDALLLFMSHGRYCALPTYIIIRRGCIVFYSIVSCRFFQIPVSAIECDARLAPFFVPCGEMRLPKFQTGIKNVNKTIMPLFRVTVKQSKLSGGLRIERGMQVDVVTNSMSNPLTVSGGQAVADAFMRIYGVDMKRLGALSTVYLDVERIG